MLLGSTTYRDRALPLGAVAFTVELAPSRQLVEKES